MVKWNWDFLAGLYTVLGVMSYLKIYERKCILQVFFFFLLIAFYNVLFLGEKNEKVFSSILMQSALQCETSGLLQ